MGLRLADKLAKVYLLNGEEKWVLIHIEVQGYYDSNFAERMFVYSNRIFERYRKFVASLVIFTDQSQSFKPDEITFKLWESEHTLRYRAVKLRDYYDHWDNLKRDPNPFSIVVMAHLKMRELGTDRVNELAVWKVELNKLLYKRSYSREWIYGFKKTIDWIIRLPDELDDRVYQEISEYEMQEVGMAFITTGERINRREGIKEGMQQGVQQGTASVALRQLTHKFGPLEPATQQAIRKLSVERLEDLSEALLDFKEKSELQEWLSNHQ